MGRDQLLEDFPWFVLSPPRRLTIGDLMAGVVLAALGCALWAVALHSQWSDDKRTAFGIVTLISLGVPLAQWGLAGIKSRRPRSGLDTSLGFLSYFLAMVAYICLFVLAIGFPEGGGLVALTMLVLVIYRTTWD
jgi:peptidoglycan/LPS O-acetylase OafA/YrhL